MRIYFSSPLAKIFGQCDCDVVVHDTITVEEVVGLLATKFARTSVFANDYLGKPWLLNGLIVLKNGRYLLGAEDRLENHDDLEIMPPIMGGIGGLTTVKVGSRRPN